MKLIFLSYSPDLPDIIFSFNYPSPFSNKNGQRDEMMTNFLPCQRGNKSNSSNTSRPSEDDDGARPTHVTGARTTTETHHQKINWQKVKHKLKY